MTSTKIKKQNIHIKANRRRNKGKYINILMDREEREGAKENRKRDYS